MFPVLRKPVNDNWKVTILFIELWLTRFLKLIA